MNFFITVADTFNELLKNILFDMCQIYFELCWKKLSTVRFRTLGLVSKTIQKVNPYQINCQKA